MEHCIVVAGLGFGEESLGVKEPMGYRIHQWQESSKGVIGRSSGIGNTKKEEKVTGEIWAKHAATEIGNCDLRVIKGHNELRYQFQ